MVKAVISLPGLKDFGDGWKFAAALEPAEAGTVAETGSICRDRSRLPHLLYHPSRLLRARLPDGGDVRDAKKGDPIMKRSSRAISWGWLMVFAMGCPGLAAPAFGADLDFLVTWSGGALGNDAKASAIITIDDTILLNPGFNNSNVDPFVVDFTMTVSGADSGNGIFGLAAFDYITLNTGPGNPGDPPLDLGVELIGQPTGGDPWGTTYAGNAGDFNVANVGADPDIPSGEWFFDMCTSGGMGDCVRLTSLRPLDSAFPSPDASWKCQEAIAKAGQKFASTLHKELGKCRDSLARGKALYQDKAKTTAIAGSHECAVAHATATKIEKAALKARKQLAKCTDAMVSTLGACASTVDGLVSADATAGCLLDTHADLVEGLLEAEYGF